MWGEMRRDASINGTIHTCENDTDFTVSAFAGVVVVCDCSMSAKPYNSLCSGLGGLL